MFWEKWKIVLVFFGSFFTVFDILNPGILVFVFKKSKGGVLEARFWTFHHTFYFSLNSEFRTFGLNFERSTGIWNVQRRFRTLIIWKTVNNLEKNIDNPETVDIKKKDIW